MSDFTANNFLNSEIGQDVPSVLALFESVGLDGPSYDTVRKWRARDSMPAYWLAKTLYALELSGGDVMSLKKYFNDKEVILCSTKKRDFSGSLPSVFD